MEMADAPAPREEAEAPREDESDPGYWAESQSRYGSDPRGDWEPEPAHGNGSASEYADAGRTDDADPADGSDAHGPAQGFDMEQDRSGQESGSSWTVPAHWTNDQP
jgi:hypothetical protein